MVELDQTFVSLTDWKEWANANSFIYNSAYANEIGERILSNGFVEPISNRKVLSADISNTSYNWREGLVNGGLNSRMRAVASIIEKELAGRERIDVCIYAPEALTGFALFLRSLYARFLGSEYEPSLERRKALYPIPHLDLMNLDLPSATFDVVSTNEVIEHIPNIDHALSELARILKPGGWHIGTHPFRFMAEAGDVRTELVDGKIVYLKEPEWHGNPVDPSGGSLVFETPGWNIIERAKQAGFVQAHMRFIASEHNGILTANTGVFVLCCQK